MATKIEEINAIVEQLKPSYQQSVLKLAQELAQLQQFIATLPKFELPPGTPGRALLGLSLPNDVVEAMERAIEDCERVEPDEC